MNRLKEKYIKEIAPKMMKELKISNVMALPKVLKVSINSGVGPFRENREALESFLEEFSSLAGQKAYPRKARQSVAGFKIRQGDIVGYSVTLRGERMWAFLDKLINIAIPRVRDFRGLEDTSFDGNGNYSLGIREHVIFPEVNPNTTKGLRSMQITVVFSTSDVEHNKYLLAGLGMPFRKDD
ncbi:MAG: 50S ribosomal protein L5 [candidate division WWE3 bacterium GW2011_GWF2_41_45]|uniref:Large ribosomal subunit protein uL5 n=3 Tax=Katanobacteria TaxID=422282 RepID=A0A1F4W3H3_UNCKA|nr:MAG: 50S ribosomal protein L5 [candidate division WWE3 bacterium GW2011_GWC2_41_23]KKS10763.1 MAG: 50S ribosomal protein L5 [candidate division WWE3 bacterium GW2011_GWF2_41_45]KKS12439.1 MAG: 50S ribosomal protein L5 [candidate division WWE3 bacterium GW2011_GWF1_41_53]KKS20182.1 MAG: 50S ribosomal protein L5 [candidate division WWE3 bacterium GW2011_GWE1_41_72]KKS28380.1 MAG: 50S ribosomal protein L5 [candidate division WWE3 bacterium GW2011_GWC1_42_102]KKS29601.1 MAG: 50S ribosomal prote